MSFKDKFSHATAVTKWKADQQMRLLKSQNQVGALEGQVRTKKAELADTVLKLYTQERISDEELLRICRDVDQIHEQIIEQKKLQELIRQEQPPQFVSYSSFSPTEPSSGLVCPECGRSLVGRFCPEHGVDGVQPSSVKDMPAQETTGVFSDQLVCPICRTPLSVRFCPEHGVEGVPVK